MYPDLERRVRGESLTGDAAVPADKGMLFRLMFILTKYDLGTAGKVMFLAEDGNKPICLNANLALLKDHVQL
jgi:hypothetical protein